MENKLMEELLILVDENDKELGACWAIIMVAPPL